MRRAPNLPAVDPGALDETCRRLGLRMLLLFGSRATGHPPPFRGSDLDLAVRSQREGKQTGFWEAYEALSALFPRDSVDLVFLEGADPLFRWEILRDGILLWGDPLDHLEYRAFAYRDFIDSEDLRALERRLFEKKLDHIRECLRAPS